MKNDCKRCKISPQKSRTNRFNYKVTKRTAKTSKQTHNYEKGQSKYKETQNRYKETPHDYRDLKQQGGKMTARDAK